MGNYGQVISKEDNDYRLCYINAFNGECPICKKRAVEGIYGGFVVDKPNVEKIIYLCNECGVVARDEIEGLSRKLNEAKRKAEIFNMVLNMFRNLRK